METAAEETVECLNAADLKHSVQYASFYMHVGKCPMKNVRENIQRFYK